LQGSCSFRRVSYLPCLGNIRVLIIARANRDDYVYEKQAGEGVVVYIIYSGVQVNVKDVSADGFVSRTEDADLLPGEWGERLHRTIRRYL
jgi:hypothetical protein